MLPHTRIELVTFSSWDWRSTDWANAAIGPNANRTHDLTNCSRPLYHWATGPLFCLVGESNTGYLRHKQMYYHYTNETSLLRESNAHHLLTKQVLCHWAKKTLDANWFSVAGNWTRITTVTGWDTNHYTTTDFALNPDRTDDLQIFSLTLSRLSYQGKVSLTGVEPVIFPLGGGRLIHWAIETKLENRTLEFFSAPRHLRDLSVHSLSTFVETVTSADALPLSYSRDNSLSWSPFGAGSGGALHKKLITAGGWVRSNDLRLILEVWVVLLWTS